MAGIKQDFALQDRRDRDHKTGLAITQSIVTGLQTKEPGQPKGLSPNDRGIFDSAAAVSAIDTLKAAAARTGLVTEEGIASINSGLRGLLETNEFDPDLNFKTLLDEEGMEDLKSFMSRVWPSEDPADMRLKSALIDSPNREDAIDLMATHQRNRLSQEEASAGGAALELLGSFVGASKDMIISIPIGGAGIAGVRATGLVSRALIELGIFSGTEAAVAGAERLIRAQRDFIIDGNKEALEAALIAGGLTALLGGGAVAIARRREVMGLIRQRAGANAGEPAAPAAGDLSSAATPADVTKTYTTTDSGSMIARFIPQVFRTLKGVVTDRMADATTRFLKSGNKADIDAANVVDGLIGPSIDRINPDTGAHIAKAPGLEDAHRAGVEEGAAWGVIIRAQHDNFVLDVFEGGKAPFGPDDFDQMVARTVWRNHKGLDNDYVLKGFGEKLTDAQKTKLIEHLDKVTGVIKERTLSNGNRAVTSGMLQEGQIIEDYIPLTPSGVHAADEDVIYEYMLDVLHKPSDESINQILPGRLEEGETFKQILKADPARAREIADDLDSALLRARGDKSYEAELDAKDVLEKFYGKTEVELKAVWQKKLAKLEEPPTARAKTAKRLAQDKVDIESLRTRLNEIDGADLPKLRALIQKFGNKGQKKNLKDLSASHTRAVAAVRKAANVEPMDILARRIAKNMVEGKIAGNIVPDRLTSNAGFTKDRVIDHDPTHPLFERIFDMRASRSLRTHSAQFHPRLFLHERYGKLKVGTEDVANVPIRQLDEISEGADAATKKRIVSDKENAVAAINAALNRDRIPGSARARAFDFWTQQLAKFNIASMLKMLGITQITDLALVVGRGRSASAGVMGVFNMRQTFALAKAARSEGQIDLIRILEGSEIMGLRNPMDDFLAARPNSRVMEMYGIDAAEVAARTRLEHSVEKGLDAINGIAGWLSFATPMNMVLRRAMGADTAKMIIDDMVNFRALKPDIQKRWLNYGIDADRADEIAAFIKGKDGTITIEGVAFPNYRLMREVNPQLAELASGAANKLAGEVFPLVTPFTKPLLARTPMGRLALQFSSFSYAVGVSVLPELKREMRHNPLGYRAAALTLGGLVASMTTLYLRAAIYGDEPLDKIHEQMGTAAGRVQLVQRAALLLPFLPGMSSQLTEMVAQAWGPSVNAVIGHDILLNNPSRFFNVGDSMVAKLAGPTGTQFTRAVRAFGAIPTAIQATAEGDPGKAQEALLKSARDLHRMTPLLDSLPLRVLMRAVEKVYPE